MFLPYSFTSNSEQKNSFTTHRKAIIEAVYLGGQNWDETARNDLQRMMASRAFIFEQIAYAKCEVFVETIVFIATRY